MNSHFEAFIATHRAILASAGFSWDIDLDHRGKAVGQTAWNLTRMSGGTKKPIQYLNNFGFEESARRLLNESSAHSGSAITDHAIVSKAWQDLIKAAVVEQIFVRKNTPAYIALSIIRPLRVIATCCPSRQPWQLTLDDILASFEIAKKAQDSGKLGDLVAGLTKILFDHNHLSDAGPLYPALSSARLTPGTQRKAKFLQSKEAMRNSLEERKRAERLPSNRAFWELVRIVMTEDPRTYMDELRFLSLRLMLVTGFRLGEAVTLPTDWRRERNYLTPAGVQPSVLGGVDRSLMIRYFAEKQNKDGGSSVNLREAIQHVPSMFVELVEDTLERAATLTRPLRDTLSRQVSSGRLLPQFQANELVPILHLYTYLSGNPFWLEFDGLETKYWIERCRSDPETQFDDLYNLQVRDLQRSSRPVNPTAYVFFNRLRRQGNVDGGLRIYDRNGRAIGDGERMRWGESHLLISELEPYLRHAKSTKVSDAGSLLVDGSNMEATGLLFLHPKRSVAEERDGIICDITRYSSISQPTNTFLAVALGETGANDTIFERYGRTDADRALKLVSHSLRHMQNNELFRLGIADSIISKRFGRTSVAQSHEYDHRTLAEELDSQEIPPDVEFSLGGKTATVLKMINAGKASGPIVEDFKRIQREEGYDAALAFLRAEADGFHATPYGTCVSSFTVSPCPKHLQCFDGCRHLTRSERPEVRRNLLDLEIKLVASLDDSRARDRKTVGAHNQLMHAERLLAGVRTLLAGEPGTHAFPDGTDFSLRSGDEP